MIEKIWVLVDVYNVLQNNGVKLLKHLTHSYTFIDYKLDKVQNQSRINIILHN